MSFGSNGGGLTSILQGVTSGLQASGQANSLRYAAAVDDENARRAVLAGEQQVSSVDRKSRAAMGESIAQMAGSGMTVGSGTAADIISASAMDAARDVATIRTQAQYQAVNYENDAAAKRSSAHSAIIGGLFGAVTGAIKSTNDARSQRTLAAAAAGQRQAVLGGSTLTSASNIKVGGFDQLNW